MIKKIKIWIKAIRAPFITSTIISGVLGAIIAWHTTGNFNWKYFWITLMGIFFLNAGTNLINDYFDHTSNLDEINKNLTPFSGGSRIIQDKLLSPREVFSGGLVSFILAGMIGLYLNYKTSGNVILYIGIIGIFLSYFYTASPLRLGYTPFGELITGLCAGPLIVFGSYYVQAQNLSLKPLWISIPLCISAGLILFINEFPDYDADKKVGKRNLVIILGKKKAVKLLILLLGIIYLFIILGILGKIFPYYSLIIFLTLPLCFKAISAARLNYNKIRELLPANASVIGLHLALGILLCVSFILDSLTK